MGNSLGFGPPPPDVEISHEGYCQRLGKSVCGVCVGLVLVPVMIILLGWNEFNYVRNQSVLLYVGKNVKEVGCTPSLANSNAGVYLSCPTSKLYSFAWDPRMGQLWHLFSDGDLNATSFKAESQIYQWKETESCTSTSDGHGGKTKTCRYSYAKAWVGSPISSSNFHCVKTSSCQQGSERITNSGTIPSELSQTLTAPDNAVTVGNAFGMNSDLLSQLGSSEPVPLLKSATYYTNYYLVPMGMGKAQFSQSPSSTTVGDIQTTFTRSSVREATTISAIAMQGQPFSGGVSLRKWDTKKSGTMSVVNWAMEGSHSKEDILDEKASENSGLKWVLRIVGWLLMFLGLQLITGPIALVPQVVPCIGDFIGEVAGCALCCMNFMVSISLSLFVISIAWLMARPLYGIVMLAMSAALIIGALCARKQLGKTSGSARTPLVMPGGQQMSVPVAMPVAPGAPQQFPVTVPQNCMPGQMLQVRAPDGRLCTVQVPPNVLPGQQFMAAV